MDSGIFTTMINLDIVLIGLSLVLCFFQTTRLEVEYFIRILAGTVSVVLSLLLSTWSINGSLYSDWGQLLDGGIASFFLILMFVMLVYVGFQALMYWDDRMNWLLDQRAKVNTRKDVLRDYGEPIETTLEADY